MNIEPDHKFRVIAVLDPSVTSENVGDEIIFDSVKAEIRRLFGDPLLIRVSTHAYMSGDASRLLKKASYVFVGGSNLLKSKMEWNIQWKLSPLDLLNRRNAILLGCGWRHDEGRPTPYTRMLYNRILSPTALHSLRDSSAQAQLQKAGFSKSLNTACVTMWNLTPEHCAAIPAQKADNVVVTLTAYHPDVESDKKLLEVAFKNYKNVSLFVQQPEDFLYARSLTDNDFYRVVASLDAYDELLSQPTDYIGTRLHGGMRAIQRQRRALIIVVDNRARDIGRDTGLPIASKQDLAQQLDGWINTPQPTRIALPDAAIAEWRSQFDIGSA
ncbi:polysaccharide pyruvyl transferase family protein [Novosphingobium resinovorum]